MVNSVNFSEVLEEKKRTIDGLLLSMLPSEEGFTENLSAAMRYSIEAGGKRLRPILMQESALLFGGAGEILLPFLAAIEMIHTSSLIHDDLPAIDNDEYRRGKKTTHAVYGEALGILSGDALLNYAYETASRAFSLEPDNPRIGQAFSILTAKTGIDGMLGGQSVDVTNEGKEISGDMLDFIYKKKTSALIEAPLMIGALLAGAEREHVEKMEQIGLCLGMAFQIRDDILDVTSTTQVLGKPVFSDEKNQKVTYVTRYGLAGASQKVEEFSQKAIEGLCELPGRNSFLEELIRYLVNREK